MNELLKKSLKTKRYIHSINTMNTAVSLAERYNENVHKAAIAGLLHDCAKNMTDDELLKYCIENGLQLSQVEKKQIFLMHGAVGAIIAREYYGIEDESILNAITRHTTGCLNMSLFDKIIFLADYIEPGRVHEEAEIARALAYEDIDKAMIFTYDSVIKYVISRDGLIHPSTIEARNALLLNRG